MRVIITINDVSHIAVPDPHGIFSCGICSLKEVCHKVFPHETVLCSFLDTDLKHHFELLIPETKTKEK